MTKINKDEYEKLKSLGNRWKWIARDKNRCLYVFTGKPVKKYGPLLYWGTDGFLSFELFDEKHLFQFIQWEDEEPYNIAELIEEYEEYLRAPVAPKFSIDGVEHLFENESEETGMKYNKLNGKTLNKILTEYFDETALSDDDAKIILDYHKFDDETLIELALGVVGLAWGTSGRKVVDILDDFDQLDEPETIEQIALLLENVLKENKRLGRLLEEKQQEWFNLMDEINNQEKLSPIWIYKHTKIVPVDEIPDQTEVVYVEDLQDLFVPKQEKPVIPQIVADWLKDRRKSGLTDIDIVELIYSIDNMDDLEVHNVDNPVKKYLNRSNENKEKIVKAVIIDNFEVEEEEKLTARAVIEKHIELLKKQEEAVNLKPYYDLLERVKMNEIRNTSKHITRNYLSKKWSENEKHI